VVVPVIRGFEEGGKPYTVMQLRKNGRFLKEEMAVLEKRDGKGTIPLPMVLSITESLLEAVQAVHSCPREGGQQGFLHLDLHPGNFFMENGDVYPMSRTMSFFEFDFLDSKI
jgi:serine/threonine protein kinase